MNAEPSIPSCSLSRPNSLLSEREDRVHRLPVRVVEEAAEPEQPDDDPGIGRLDRSRTAAECCLVHAISRAGRLRCACVW